MLLIYSILIKAYFVVVKIVSLFNSKASQWIIGRQRTSKLESDLKKWEGFPILLVHAASYGEFEMSKPIIEGIMLENQNVRFVISFFSPSGYNNIHLEEDRFLKVYLPLDTLKKQEKFVKLIKPKAVLFIKYEFWFNLIQVLNKNDVPYYYCGLHLNRNSYLLRPIFKPFTNLLRKAEKIYCHSDLSMEILRSNGFDNLEVLGDTRVEQVLLNKSEKSNQFIKEPMRFLEGLPVIIFGSFTNYELDDIIGLCKHLKGYNFILAPHDVNSETLGKIEKFIGESVSYLSKKSVRWENILLVDTYGDLKYLYRHANLAYVGGGFEKGPHNLLEPLVYGIPIFCGPNIEKFPMAQYLKEKKLLGIINQRKHLDEMITVYNTLDLTNYKEKVEYFFANNRSNLPHLIKELCSKF